MLPLRFAKFKSTQEYSLESHHLNVLHSGPEWIAYIVGILPKLEEMSILGTRATIVEKRAHIPEIDHGPFSIIK